MQPCLLSRLHKYYPQYVPTLFPYTTPSVDGPSQLPSVSSGKASSVSRVTRVSSIASPAKVTPVSSALSTSSRNDKKSAARSSPAVVLQRVKRTTTNTSEFGTSTDESSVSAVRRASLPARPEALPLQRKSGSPGITAISRQRVSVVETTDEDVSNPSQRGSRSRYNSGTRVARYNVNPTSIQSNPAHVKEPQYIRTASPPVRPVVHSVPKEESSEKKKVYIQPVPINNEFKGEVMWRVPNEQELLRHEKELSQLRGMFLCRHK